MLLITQLAQSQWIIMLLILWTIPWTGIALWKSARRGEKVWFIVLLVLNTLAILEILYIFVFSKKKTGSVESVELSNEQGEPETH